MMECFHAHQWIAISLQLTLDVEAAHVARVKHPLRAMSTMKKLKQSRERARLSQAELAVRANTTPEMLAKWETGKSKPTMADLRDLAIALETCVDALLGRPPVFVYQTTRIYAGDDNGYWGNIGIRFPAADKSVWYPISTTTTAEMHASYEASAEGEWDRFQTLNNKLVLFVPSRMNLITFVSEADDHIPNDWDVGAFDVTGLQPEFYDVFERISEEMGEETNTKEFSSHLLGRAERLIEKHELSDEQVADISLLTLVRFTDGSKRSFCLSEADVAGLYVNFHEHANFTETSLIRLRADDRDHYVPKSKIASIELPLNIAIRGLRRIGFDDYS